MYKWDHEVLEQPKACGEARFHSILGLETTQLFVFSHLLQESVPLHAQALLQRPAH